MKPGKRAMRLSLFVAVTAAVSFPLISQIRSNRAKAADAPATVADHAAATDPASAPGAPRLPITGLPEVPPDKVVMTIGDQKVTAGEFSAFFADLDPAVQSRVLQHPEMRRSLAEQYVDLKLMAAEAKKQKLDESTRVKTTYDQLLANALMMNIGDQRDANLKFYNENKTYFEELQARHILIGITGTGVGGAMLDEPHAKAKAEEIRKRLVDKPSDFESIARTESDDKGSATQGGMLGTMARGQMVPEFEKAAFSLKDNEISEPVKTQFGYHIIQILSRSTPAYELVAQRVPRRRLELLLEQMKQATQPDLDESYFGPAKGKAKAPTTAPATRPAVAPAAPAAPVAPAK